MIVVADTGPINYLILINRADLLAQLFGAVVIPPAVAGELLREETPVIVRRWMSDRPAWLQVQTPSQWDRTLDLDEGEQQAMSLALELKADVLLVDEKKARRFALARGLRVTGTLGVVRLASVQGLVDHREVLDELRRTNFYFDESLIPRIFGD